MSIGDKKGKQRPLLEGLATEETQQSIAGLVNAPYDTIEVNFTDDTKEIIDTVVFKLNGNIVNTITATNPTTTKEIYTTL